MLLLRDLVATISVEFVRHLQHPEGYRPHRYQRWDDPCNTATWMKVLSRSGVWNIGFWRAVDSEGQILDILVQSRRNDRAAKPFISRLIARCGVPRMIIMDKLRSYGAALRKLALDVDHRANKGLITASKDHTGRRGNESRYKDASSQPAKPEGYWPSTMKP